MCMGVLVQACHAWCPQKPEEGIRFPKTGTVDGSEPLCGFWELKLGSTRAASAPNH